jgi:putative transposase
MIGVGGWERSGSATDGVCEELEMGDGFEDAGGMGAYAQLFVHLVWATEGRQPWIVPSLREPLYAAITAKCRALGCPPIAVGGVEDHVHLLVSLTPALSVAKLVKDVKGSSSHLVTHMLAQETQFRWQAGYGAFSLRRDDVPVVRHYVGRQREHHASNTIEPSWEQTEP